MKRPPTSLSIQGRPLQVAKQPNSPNRTMAAPVPASTYGALEGPPEISSMYGPNMNFHHNPTESRTTPVI